MHEPDEVQLFAERLNAIGVDYMITGATAAILYGQPRVTNDIDVVLALQDRQVPALIAAFPDTAFYLPPESVIRVEQGRRHRGHFNILHYDSGFKADIYLAGDDPLHTWAFPLRRRIRWADGVDLQVAPPEYVIVRKLEFFREGGSTKHPADIRAILGSTDVNREAVDAWTGRLGLAELWADMRERTS